jgi:glycosyltransferase involved in cell wall biosynthesis
MTRVLHLIPYMHPSAGGPPVVVDQWCAELRRRGVEAEVLTTDAYASADDQAWQAEYAARYPLAVVKCVGPRGFGYSSQLRPVLADRLKHVDLVHVHNVWGYANRLAARLCPKWDVPFVVSTHGMLDPHSMGRKAWKKRLYGRLFEFPALRQASGLIFTHAEEERLARETCGPLPTGFVVPLGTSDPPAESRSVLASQFLRQFPATARGPRVMFLSRLHEKKGLDLLLPAFQRVLQNHSSGQLVLVGPGEEDYVQELRSRANSLGISQQTHFIGSLHGEQKWAALAAADVYVLPSYQENFAIALVEALRVGTPVVCSQRVNIWSDLANAGAATICELTVESVAESILRLLDDRSGAEEQGGRGAAFAAENYTWAKSVERLVDVYKRVVISH